MSFPKNSCSRESWFFHASSSHSALTVGFHTIAAANPIRGETAKQAQLYGLCRKFCSGGAEGAIVPVGGVIRCSGLQTVAPEPANKGCFGLTFRANKRRVGLTLAANEPTLNANSPQTTS
jgi:hypothetical protein